MSAGASVLTADPTPGADGKQPVAQDWRTSLPEDLRGDASIKDFKDVSSLAKSFIEGQKLIGGSARVPKPDASEEDWAKFYARTGRPETADKYEFKLPEGQKVDEKLVTNFKSWAHEAGLQPRQAQRLLDKYVAQQSETIAEYNKSMTDGVAELKKEWGADFDKNASLAVKAVKELGGDEMKELLESTGLGNHPTLIKFFASLGEQLGEETIVVGDGPSAQDQESKDAIQIKIDAIKRDKNHPYNNRNASHAAREAALREVNSLYEKLYGTEAAVGIGGPVG